MYRKSFVVGLAVLFSSLQPLFAQNRVEKSLRKALANEVQRLIVFFDLDEETQAEIIEACTDRMETEITRVDQMYRDARQNRRGRDGETQNIAEYHKDNLSQEMLDFVREKVRDRLPGDADSAMSEYVADATGLREIYRQVQQEDFIRILDSSVSLTKEQERELLTFTKRKWKGHWKTGAMALSEIADLERSSAFFEKEGRQLLTDEQAAFVDQYRLPVTLVEQVKVSQPDPQESDWDESDFQEMCLKILSLQRTELSGTKLNEEQLKILSVGEKAAAKKLTQIWRNAYDEISKRGNRSPVNQLGRSTIRFQCTQLEEWRVAVRKTLGESAIETMERERQATSISRFKQARLSALTNFLNSLTGVSLTHRQFKQLEKLVVEHIDPPSEDVSMMQYFYSVFSLPNNDFQQVLKPFQWEMAKDVILRYRDSYEQKMERGWDNE